MYIGGEWRQASDGATINAFNPANGSALATIPDATQRDVDDAVRAARAAFLGWAETPVQARSRAMLDIADLIQDNLDFLATVESMDNGKPIRETSNADIPLSVDHFRYFAGVMRADEGAATMICLLYTSICQYTENVLLSDQMSSLGADRDARKRALYRGGLKIQTVVEPDAQDAAQSAITALVKPTDPVVSVAVMTDPKTGLIKAMAQSKPVMGTNTDAGETYYNYAVGQDMGGAEGYQAGSTFKAFVAAAAISEGFIPSQTYYNAPATKNWEGTTFKNCDGNFVFKSGDGQGWTCLLYTSRCV